MANRMVNIALAAAIVFLAAGFAGGWLR